MHLLNQFDGLKAIHDWHVDVENNDVEVVPRVRSYNLDCLHSVLRYLYLEKFLKLGSVHINHQRLVISKKHLGLKKSKLLQAVFA